MGNMMWSAGTQRDSFPPLSPWTFFTSQFGQPSNKTISKYGNPGPALMQTPPSLPLSLSSSLALCSWPQERGGQVYFLHGGPFEVAARPLPRRRWCIRWGSLKRCRWDSFITTALNLIVPVKGYSVRGQKWSEGGRVVEVTHVSNASRWEVVWIKQNKHIGRNNNVNISMTTEKKRHLLVKTMRWGEKS